MVFSCADRTDEMYRFRNCYRAKNQGNTIPQGWCKEETRHLGGQGRRVVDASTFACERVYRVNDEYIVNNNTVGGERTEKREREKKKTKCMLYTYRSRHGRGPRRRLRRRWWRWFDGIGCQKPVGPFTCRCPVSTWFTRTCTAGHELYACVTNAVRNACQKDIVGLGGRLSSHTPLGREREREINFSYRCCDGTGVPFSRNASPSPLSTAAAMCAAPHCVLYSIHAVAHYQRVRDHHGR